MIDFFRGFWLIIRMRTAKSIGIDDGAEWPAFGKQLDRQPLWTPAKIWICALQTSDWPKLVVQTELKTGSKQLYAVWENSEEININTVGHLKSFNELHLAGLLWPRSSIDMLVYWETKIQKNETYHRRRIHFTIRQLKTHNTFYKRNRIRDEHSDSYIYTVLHRKVVEVG